MIHLFSARALACSLVLSALGGCSGSAEPTLDTSNDDLSNLAMKTGHYARSGDVSPGVLTDLVLKAGHRFDAVGYADTFWGPANEEETHTFSGTFKVKDNTLTLLTPKGNEYEAYSVKVAGAKYSFSRTTEQGRPVAFELTYAGSDTTLPTQTSKDPGMPAAVPGGHQLRCQGGLFGTNFAITRAGGWMYHFAGEPKQIDHVKLGPNPAEASDASWIRLAGSGTKGGETHNDYEVNLPAAALRAGARGVTVDVFVGSDSSGTYTATQVDCDAAD